MARWRVAARPVCVVAACAALALSCATNPVTGKKQLVLISEAQEIAMGREADKEVVATYGLYPDDALQRYVQDLGGPIGASSERPALPWTFRVVDDASVNAFAIPGGFIYLTRGILTHLNSEAELVAIMGHEIGHVTARHSVSQMSKQQLAQVGLVAGMVLSPQVARFGQLAQTGLGVLFLKFSRDDERQADQLGFKYLVAGGYDPRRMVDVFRMLDRLSAQGEDGGGRLPQWLSTHPDPGNRQAWAADSVRALSRDVTRMASNRPAYLRRVDGLVFGENPREGFFQGTAFHHPDMAFRMDFPSGWKGSNQKQAVGAVSSQQDAMVVLQLAAGNGARQAAEKFAGQEGVEALREWRREIGGFPATSFTFRASGEQAMLRGLAAFIEYQGRVFQVIGYSAESRWADYQEAVARSIGSFGRETDPAVLGVKPQRLSVVNVTRPSSIGALAEEYPSSVSSAVVTLINNWPANSLVPAGEKFKRVVGGR